MFSAFFPDPVEMAVIHLQNGSAVVEILGEIWPVRGPPSDGSPYVDTNFPFLWLVITSNAFAAITILAAAVCLVFNFALRKRKYVVHVRRCPVHNRPFSHKQLVAQLA